MVESCTLHVIDHAPESAAWALMRQAIAPGDAVLLVETALLVRSDALGLGDSVTVFHLHEHAKALAVDAPGEPINYAAWVARCAAGCVRCW